MILAMANQTDMIYITTLHKMFFAGESTREIVVKLFFFHKPAFDCKSDPLHPDLQPFWMGETPFAHIIQPPYTGLTSDISHNCCEWNPMCLLTISLILPSGLVIRNHMFWLTPPFPQKKTSPVLVGDLSWHESHGKMTVKLILSLPGRGLL